MDILKLLIVLAAIFAGVILLMNNIGRSWVYADLEHGREMEICLSKEVAFQDCYRAIYDRSSFK